MRFLFIWGWPILTVLVFIFWIWSVIQYYSGAGNFAFLWKAPLVIVYGIAHFFYKIKSFEDENKYKKYRWILLIYIWLVIILIYYF